MFYDSLSLLRLRLRTRAHVRRRRRSVASVKSARVGPAHCDRGARPRLTLDSFRQTVEPRRSGSQLFAIRALNEYKPQRISAAAVRGGNCSPGEPATQGRASVFATSRVNSRDNECEIVVCPSAYRRDGGSRLC